MFKVLTIAGSDSGGGAGIQADIKTITACGMYAMSAVTALTAQNTEGVYGILQTPADFIVRQLECIFTDIYPDAVKIGMLGNTAAAEATADTLSRFGARNVVIDPVMVSTSGNRLLKEDAVHVMFEKLFPLGTLITPNIPEAAALCGFDIKKREDMLRAAQTLSRKLPCAILIKGGHLGDCADDLLYEKENAVWFRSDRIQNPNTHGTGCTLSSAVACGLAAGKSLTDSVREAKRYLTGALESMLDLGAGCGPVNHMYRIPPVENS